MSESTRLALGAGVCALVLLVFSAATGCASGREVGTQVSDGGTSGTTTSNMNNVGGDAGVGAMGTGGEPMGGMGGGPGAGGMGADGGMGGMDPCASGCPTNTYDIDNNPLTGECGCEYACVQQSQDDPLDDNFTDDNCDGSDGEMEDCVFVSASDGTSNGAGTRLDPVNTIALGISVADANNVSSVCVSGETYTELVTMVSGINVLGGFDHEDVDFKFRRKASVTSIVQQSGTVFLAQGINQETHIEGLTIEAFTPTQPGGSTYGIRLVGGSADLVVRFNDIHAFPGADGVNGGDGTPHATNQALSGNNGGDSCEEEDDPCAGNDAMGGAQPACTLFGGKGGDGNMGANGTSGNAGNSGSPSGGLFGTASTQHNGNTCIPEPPTPPAMLHGTDGADNTANGNNGLVGTKGNSVGSVAGGAYVAADGGNGSSGVDGAGGPGGGGGGGQDVDTICEAISSSSDDAGAGGGSGGCGGLGGAFGEGGGGGGGSFGIFVSAGRVVVTDNSITTDGGGDGADGGTGQRGQNGGLGGLGGAQIDDGGNGGDGGDGSNGGHGGPGAGGGGGPCAILGFAPGVIFTLNSNTTSLGSGGNGGSGGTNPISNANAPDGDDGINSVTLQIN